jgi:hypothetical protein
MAVGDGLVAEVHAAIASWIAAAPASEPITSFVFVM